MKKIVTEFKDFISRGNVMDMAVGVIVGGAAASHAPSAREGRGGRRPTRGPAEGRARLRRIWPAEKIFGGNAIKCRRPGTYLVEEKNDAKEGKP